MKTILWQSMVMLMLLMISAISKAQIGIGTNAPDTCVMLEIQSPKKGVLLPRVDDAQSADKVHASLLFDNATGKYKYFDGTNWLSVNPLNPDVQDNVVAPKNLTVEENVTIKGQATVETTMLINGTSVSAPNATVTGNTFVGYGTVPLGGIIMWSGTVIPDGWALCNGSVVNGYTTPNLAGRFIVGYAANVPSYNQPGTLSQKGVVLGSTGGEEFHILKESELPSHVHRVDIGSSSAGAHNHFIRSDGNRGPGGGGREVQNYEAGATQTTTSSALDHVHQIVGDTQSTGSNQPPHENRPPYYVLAFIMRVK